MITERHELVEHYLADLDRRLAGAEPGERADIVASVREHVEVELASLGRPATSADVAAVLDTLGSVDAVVATWAPDGPAPAVPPMSAATPAPSSPPTADAAPRRATGLVITAGALAVLAVLSIALPPLAGVLGAGALVLGIVAVRRGDEPRWVSITSIVVGAVAVVVGLLVVLAAAFLFAVRSDGPAVQEGPMVSEAPPQPTQG